MKKFRVFIVELFLVGIVVAWIYEKFPAAIDRFIPIIVMLILWHLTYECILDTRWVKSKAQTALARWKYMVWVIAFVGGGLVSVLYLYSVRAGLTSIAATKNDEKIAVKKEAPLHQQLREEETLAQLRKLDLAELEAVRIVLVAGPMLPNQIEKRVQQKELSRPDRNVVNDVRSKTTLFQGSFSGEISLNPDLKNSIEKLLPEFKPLAAVSDNHPNSTPPTAHVKSEPQKPTTSKGAPKAAPPVVQVVSLPIDLDNDSRNLIRQKLGQSKGSVGMAVDTGDARSVDSANLLETIFGQAGWNVSRVNNSKMGFSVATDKGTYSITEPFACLGPDTTATKAVKDAFDSVHLRCNWYPHQMGIFLRQGNVDLEMIIQGHH
jgi:hypothetical protein